MTSRKRVVRGGSSASKTCGILPILIDLCARTPSLEVSVISESIPHLKKGAMKDFIKIMKWTGRWNENHWNATDRKYTFHNESYIEFFSPESVLGSRRNILYVNEANNIRYEDYVQLAMRTSDLIFLDYNPAAEFWADTEVLKEPDSELLVLTYLDNEARPKNVDSDFAIFRQKAEQERLLGLPITSYWQNYCRVYIDGEIGNIQGVVFNNWSQIDSVPVESELVAYGLDWGFTNDPTALIAVYKWNEKIILDELIYESGLTNTQIVERMKSLGVRLDVEIIADSAEPKSIRDLQNMGFPNTTAAQKGQDSVKNGIDKMQASVILITKRSTNTIKEFRGYRWLVDKSGKSLNVPIDHLNHAIDPTRYVYLNKLGTQEEWTFHR